MYKNICDFSSKFQNLIKGSETFANRKMTQNVAKKWIPTPRGDIKKR